MVNVPVEMVVLTFVIVGSVGAFCSWFCELLWNMDRPKTIKQNIP